MRSALPRRMEKPRTKRGLARSPSESDSTARPWGPQGRQVPAQPRSLSSSSLGPQSAAMTAGGAGGGRRTSSRTRQRPSRRPTSTVANSAEAQGPRLEAQLCFSLAETSQAPGLKLWGLGEESAPPGAGVLASGHLPVSHPAVKNSRCERKQGRPGPGQDSEHSLARPSPRAAREGLTTSDDDHHRSPDPDGGGGPPRTAITEV